MRILLACTLASFVIFGVTGCSGNKQEEAPPKITMPMDNNAAGAKDAPAAPRETDTPTPGEMKSKARRGL